MAENFLGDIRLSVLKPEVFLALNDGWALADGQAMEQNSDLFGIYNQFGLLNDPMYEEIRNNLPDARGRFLRAMNAGSQDVQTRDPDGNTRKVGQFQGDSIRRHAHSYLKGYFPGAGKSGAGNPPVWSSNQQADSSEFGGEETRPKNIPVFVYIKVNNL